MLTYVWEKYLIFVFEFIGWVNLYLFEWNVSKWSATYVIVIPVVAFVLHLFIYELSIIVTQDETF